MHRDSSQCSMVSYMGRKSKNGDMCKRLADSLCCAANAAKQVCLCVLSCVRLCGPMDCSPPDSSVHGIFQARALEWVTVSSSRASSQLRDGTRVSRASALAGKFSTTELKVLRNKVNKQTNKQKMTGRTVGEKMMEGPWWISQYSWIQDTLTLTYWVFQRGF